VDNITPTGTFLGVTPSSKFGTSISYPMQLAVGYGFQVTKNFRLETDVEWIQFSRFKSLNLNLGNNNALFTVLGQPTSVAQNWHDTFTIGLGGDWKFADNWTLMGSYQFYESPVPDATFSPTIPDANQNVFTLGLRYVNGRHSVEGAYALDLFDKRTIAASTPSNGGAFNGTYDIIIHHFSLAYHYAF
jgi:long-chain fatty acid transport protein